MATKTETSNEQAVQVANTILQQIGGGALFMIGAKDKFAVNDKFGGVQFKTMRTAKGFANFVKIVLDASDTYTMTFKRIRGTSVQEVAEVSDVYFDMLRPMIEKYTGLYTKM
jgi:hypothetical protein